MSDDNAAFPNENSDVGLGDQGFPDEQNTEPSDLTTEQTENLPEENLGQEQDQEHQQDAQEKPKAKKGRVPGKTRINQLMRDKYHAENEAQLLRAENEKLKKLNENSNQAAMAHYDNTVKLRLDRAKQLKAQAIETGDVQAQIDADVELSRVAAQIEQLDAWKAQESYKQKQQQQYTTEQENAQPYYEAPQINEETETWLSENPWFDPRTPDYDPDMQAEVKAYADALDRKLARSGQEDKIMSREYFEAINEYVQREFYNDVQPQRRNLNMKSASRAQVAPVGNRSAAPQNNARIVLTADEKDLIRLGKIDEKEYIKQKALIQKNSQLRGEQRRG